MKEKALTELSFTSHGKYLLVSDILRQAGTIFGAEERSVRGPQVQALWSGEYHLRGYVIRVIPMQDGVSTATVHRPCRTSHTLPGIPGVKLELDR